MWLVVCSSGKERPITIIISIVCELLAVLRRKETRENFIFCFVKVDSEEAE